MALKDEDEVSKVFSFSVTNQKLKEKLEEWQDDKIFSAMINKTLKKALNIE